MSTFAEESKRQWSVSSGGNPTVEQINCGSLQRIASAVETMAKKTTDLISERDNYKRLFEQQREVARHLKLQVIALRGVITRMKNKAAVNS